jgi:hypothetical protein
MLYVRAFYVVCTCILCCMYVHFILYVPRILCCMYVHFMLYVCALYFVCACILRCMYVHFTLYVCAFYVVCTCILCCMYVHFMMYVRAFYVVCTCILWCMYVHFIVSLIRNQQTHKIINKYKMYFQPLYMFRQVNCHLQGYLSRNFKYVLHSNTNSWFYSRNIYAARNV